MSLMIANAHTMGIDWRHGVGPIFRENQEIKFATKGRLYGPLTLNCRCHR